MQVSHRRPLVAGNWKMHGSLVETRARMAELLAGLAGARCEVVVAPPYLHVPLVADLAAGSALAVAAQDVSEVDNGARTGEVSARMLADAGCRYVLVGHSECRQFGGDTDAVVVAKFRQAREHGLLPVLCVGETLAQRDAGETALVVAGQLDAVLDAVGAEGFCGAVVAYEPVWAIGTGRQATPEQAQEVHALLRRGLEGRGGGLAAATRILYGGSVKASNAAGLFAMPDVDGGLVGGASLDAREFLDICACAR